MSTETTEEIVPIDLQHLPAVEGESWSLKLEADSLTLCGPGDALALILIRSEAARHIRFARDLAHGRTLSFIVVEGLKAHKFRCGTELMDSLLSWLPQKPLAEIKKKARLTGVLIALAGIFLIVSGAAVHPVWGGGLLVLGIAGAALPRRGFYAVNGALMVLIGLIQLFFRQDPGAATTADQTLPTIAGIVLLCWSMQQFSQCSPNHLLRIARAERDKKDALVSRVPSRLVKRVGRCNLLSAIAFACYSAGLLITSARGAGFTSITPDLTVFVVLTLLTLASAITLGLRKGPAYLEAKISAQALIAAWVLFFWGVGFNFHPAEPLSVFSGALSQGLFLLERPYVWVPLVVLILGFNQWFSGAIERELEQNRA